MSFKIIGCLTTRKQDVFKSTLKPDEPDESSKALSVGPEIQCRSLRSAIARKVETFVMNSRELCLGGLQIRTKRGIDVQSSNRGRY